MSKLRKAAALIVASVMLAGCATSAWAVLPPETEIETVQQFLEINNNPQGFYKLTADLDFGNTEYGAPIISKLSGDLNGNGHKITGVNVKSTTSAGLIGTLTGLVKNLNLTASLEITNDAAVKNVSAGGVAVSNLGTITNLCADVSITVSPAGTATVGGISATNGNVMNAGTVSSCVVTGNITVNDGGTQVFAGGISGKTGNFICVENKAAVTADCPQTSLVYAAGISAYEGSAKYCVNSGKISATAGFQAYAGGIDAFFGTLTNLFVQNCKNSGDITAVVSGSQDLDDIENSRAAAGGIAGYMANISPVLEQVAEENCTSTVRNSKNSGAVSATSANNEVSCTAGGIAGLVNGLIYNCLDDTAAKITATANGPVFGALNPSGALRGKVRNCYYSQTQTEYAPVVGNSSTVALTSALSAADLIIADSFDGFNFTDTWKLDEGMTMPEPVILDVHEHVYTTDVIPATCTENEITVYTCNICGYYYREEKPDSALGHTWGEYVYNNDATLDHDGTKTRTCSICGETETITAEGTKIVLVNSNETFPDVETGKWYTKYVDYVVTLKLMKGTSDNEFEPSTNLTRAMFVQILANISGVDTTDRNVTTKFADVPSGKWFTPAVKWASENGIVNGLDDNNFGPSENIQRQQVCVMLVRFANFKQITLKETVAQTAFADDAQINNYARDAVYACEMAGIVNGVDAAGNFEPRGNATRSQISKIIAVFHQDYILGK